MLGTPENVSKALAAESERQTGQSKLEYDDALPHLQFLVSQNFHTENKDQALIELDASGSGYCKEDKQVQRSLSVSIKHQYRKLV